MNEEEKKAADAKASADKAKAEAEAKAKAEAEAKALQDDPVKKELEKVKKDKLTKKERLEHAKKKIEGQLADLEKEEKGVPSETIDEDEPLTVGKLKELQKGESKKTALELADAIEDENERQLAKHYLETRIIPSGNPEEDVRLARAAVNAVKNARIAEEALRKGKSRSVPSAPGAPARNDPVFTPTPQEAVFMGPPYNLTKDDIIAARQRIEAKQPQE